jgi:hypothetical protein
MRIEQSHADAGVFAEFEVVQAATQSAFCDDLSPFPKSLSCFVHSRNLSRGVWIWSSLKDSVIFP